VSAKKSLSSSRVTEIRNKKASHKYFLEDKVEAGVVLTGTEVKSIRAGKAQINEAFVRFDKNYPILYNAHIEEYAFGNLNNHEPRRPRRLLLHKKEIRKLQAALEAKGYSIVPVRMYFKGSLVKVEIALGKGKKLHDKRDDLKKRTALREAEQSFKQKYHIR
tara:strand:- start:3162 stop:3647 length:486 start_codon:yes stop_codon:yes gene_type:complete